MTSTTETSAAGRNSPHPAPPLLDEKPSPAMLMLDLLLVPEGSAHARDHP
jgi:hypothetical protein